MKWLILLAVVLAPAVVTAQNNAGTVPPNGGLVICKEQSFYANSLARAIVFTKAVQRGPSTTQYFGTGGENTLVPADGMIASFGPEQINVTELSPAQLDPYEATMDHFLELEKINQQVAQVLAPFVEKMKANIGMVKGGKILVGGEWKANAGSQSSVPVTTIKQAHLKSLTTTDGDTYKNVTYKSSDDQKVAFSHSDGVAKISWNKIQKEDQIAWEYNPEKAKAERLAREKAAEEKLFVPVTTSTEATSLSGTVSLQSPNTNADQVKEVVATGIGLDGVSAEKQALIAAVQQAVGTFLDSKSITENEEVIKDRILSLSNGFVNKYDVISGPKQRDDKLFEVTIRAQVQGGQVVAKLKEVNLIKGDVAGQALYAKNMTQMSSAEDACKMLNEKLPELFVNCIKMEFVDENGSPLPNSNPVDQVRDDQTQKVKCTWYVKASVDKAFYAANIYPMFKRCLDAIFTGASEDMELNNIDASALYQHCNEPPYKKMAEESLAMRTLGEYKPWNSSYGHGQKDFFLIKSATRDGIHCIGTLYSGKKYLLKGKSDPDPLSDSKIRTEPQRGSFNDPYNNLTSSVELKIFSKSSDMIAFGDAKCSDPFNPTRQIIGPFMTYENHDVSTPFISILFQESEIARITVDLAINDLKDIGKLEVSLRPTKYSLQVTPADFKK